MFLSLPTLQVENSDGDLLDKAEGRLSVLGGEDYLTARKRLKESLVLDNLKHQNGGSIIRNKGSATERSESSLNDSVHESDDDKSNGGTNDQEDIRSRGSLINLKFGRLKQTPVNEEEQE